MGGLEFDGVPTDADNVNDDNESISSLVDEDVDFDYVYAMFHFPQMVEGQVTVDEGEKLTLLDDSNSYWWLVQNLRDNQMGYIPADNIETAFGKLARVNRRKNLKLCKPDPEHIMNSRVPTVANNNGRRVVFNDKIVTDVFITDARSDDEYDEYDEDDENFGYDYDDEEEEEGVEEAEHHGDQQVAASRGAGLDEAHGDMGFDDEDEDGDDYGYYYSSNAGNPDGYAARGASEDSRSSMAGNIDPVQASGSTTVSSRRVSMAPAHVGHISGEQQLGDSDVDMSDDDDDGHDRLGGPGSRRDANAENRPVSVADSMYSERQRDSAMLPHVVTDLSDYYLANDGSDEGDSLSGALNRLNGSARTSSVDSGAFMVSVQHTDAFSSGDSVVSVFADEQFADVVQRSLAVFSLTQAMGAALEVYARLQGHELMPLDASTGVGEFFGELRKQYGDRLFDAGSVDPAICTIVLADRAVPHAQLVAASPRQPTAAAGLDEDEDDPYMAMDTGSHSILRTSLSAPPVASAPPAQPPAERAPSVAMSDPAVTTDAAKRASKLRALSASFSARERPLSETPSGPAPGGDPAAQPADGLPDSRKVVQGLLRSIPPPRSQPPASALTRLSTGKRHTVQLSARGSVVDGDYAVSRPASQTHSTLARSASTRTPAPSHAPMHPHDEDTIRPAPVANPADNINGSQTLGQSASTLRPSSDTFADEAQGGVREREAAAGAEHEGGRDEEEGSETAEAEAEDVVPMSPASSTGTSDTASYIHDSDDRASLAAATTTAAAAAHAAAAAAVASVSLAHRSLKDSASARTSLLSRASVVSTASMAADRLSIVSLAAEELSLDDWLVILHGWNDMHDVSATTTSFYQAFLKDMQINGIGGGGADNEAGLRESQEYIQRHVAELQMAGNESQTAIDDILGVSQGVGRRLDSLERELDDIARILVHAN
ncbi:protein phosphatase regulator [Coemansia erecta]|uniref:Protein phosphatase regulator n=1 Tax=Coemansia erecta TaxID=147472 RepID=A0A9W7Y5L8_9FUNG|nr:protein phosphatase regulator [Coemansia erecta]